jgi:hypothetical protein
MDLGEIEIENLDSVNLATASDRWRDLVNTVTNTGVP